MLLSKERLDCYVDLNLGEVFSDFEYHILVKELDNSVYVRLYDYCFKIGSFKEFSSHHLLSFFDIKCLISSFYELSYRAQYDDVLSSFLIEDIFSLRNYIYDKYYFKNLEFLELFDEFCFEISRKHLTSI